MEEIINVLRKQLEDTGADYACIALTLKDGYVFKYSLETPDYQEEDNYSDDLEEEYYD